MFVFVCVCMFHFRANTSDVMKWCIVSGGWLNIRTKQEKNRIKRGERYFFNQKQPIFIFLEILQCFAIAIAFESMKHEERAEGWERGLVTNLLGLLKSFMYFSFRNTHLIFSFRFSSAAWISLRNLLDSLVLFFFSSSNSSREYLNIVAVFSFWSNIVMRASVFDAAGKSSSKCTCKFLVTALILLYRLLRTGRAVLAITHAKSIAQLRAIFRFVLDLALICPEFGTKRNHSQSIGK